MEKVSHVASEEKMVLIFERLIFDQLLLWLLAYVQKRDGKKSKKRVRNNFFSFYYTDNNNCTVIAKLRLFTIMFVIFLFI